MFECYSSSFSVTLLKTINACTTRSANVLPDLIHDTIHISNSDHSPTPSNMQMSQQRKTPCSSLLTNSVPSTLLFSMVLQLHPFAASIAPSIPSDASAVAASFAPAAASLPLEEAFPSAASAPVPPSLVDYMYFDCWACLLSIID